MINIEGSITYIKKTRKKLSKNSKETIQTSTITVQTESYTVTEKATLRKQMPVIADVAYADGMITKSAAFIQDAPGSITFECDFGTRGIKEYTIDNISDYEVSFKRSGDKLVFSFKVTFDTELNENIDGLIGFPLTVTI